MVREITCPEQVRGEMSLLGVESMLSTEELFYPAMDRCEEEIMKLPPIHFPIEETFTEGMYARSCTLLARDESLEVKQVGTLCMSAIHLQQHQYVVLEGAGKIFEVNPSGAKIIEFDTQVTGPFFGITQANTRRLLFITRKTVFKTFHPNPYNLDGESLLKIITGNRVNPFVSPLAFEDRRMKAKIRHLQLTENP